jgi:cyclase
VVECDKDVLVFDTQTRPSAARAIIAEIKKLTPKPVRYVVNSHWHPDHWTGNAEFVHAWPGLDVVATVKTNEFMHAVSPVWPKFFPVQVESTQAGLKQEIAMGKQADGTPLTSAIRAEDEDDARNFADMAREVAAEPRVFPTLTYNGAMTLHEEGREIRLLEVTGDCEGTTVMYLPKEKILVTGDAVSYPIPFSCWLTSKHLASLRDLAKLDLAVIVPGHGPAFHDRSWLELETRLLQEIEDGVHAQLAKGVMRLADVQSAVTCEDLRQGFTGGDPDLEQRFQARVKALVKFAVVEARGGVELPL